MILLVALAGGLGAAARYTVDGFVTRRSSAPIPLGTWLINVVGSLLLGLAVGSLGTSETGRVVGVGFLGGFTTFSTACVETARLILDERRPTRFAVVHAVGMAVTAVLAAALGLAIG